MIPTRYSLRLLSSFSSHYAVRRSFCSSTVTTMNLNEYNKLAEDVLEDIMVKMNVIEDIVEDIDISYSQGVLNLNLGNKGVWVINKQTPNRQIWWSSPISGPHRFEYHHNKDHGRSGWYLTRINSQNEKISSSEIISMLSSEMKKVTGRGFEE